MIFTCIFNGINIFIFRAFDYEYFEIRMKIMCFKNKYQPNKLK